MKKLPYAEDAPYWKTGTSSPGKWLDDAARHIQKFGGRVVVKAEGVDPATSRSALMLAFEMDGQQFRALWPILPVKGYANQRQREIAERAAATQAATLLYHDIKEKCNKAFVFGARVAFFEYLLLPDGRVVSDVADEDVMSGIPNILALASGRN